MKLSEDLKYWRAERPDEWTMDDFTRKAEELEKTLTKKPDAGASVPCSDFLCGPLIEKEQLGKAGERIKSWCKDWGHYKKEPLLVQRMRKRNLTNENIADVLEIIGDTCMGCRDNTTPCRCWDDS